jgi:hypothetical protein
MKNEQEPEGGFTANEMRTDYARSHVWIDHARDLEHRRTPDIHTFEDVLHVRASVVRAGDSRTADLLVEAAHQLTALADRLAGEKREHRETMRIANLAHNEREALERKVRELEAEAATMRLHIETLGGGAVL